MHGRKFSFLLKFRGWISLAFLLAIFVSVWELKKEIRSVGKSHKKYKRVYEVIESKFNRAIPLFGGMPVPVELRNVPSGEEDGVVIGVKKISLRNILAPYNASIIEDGDHFRLFFRYDVFDPKCPGPFYSYIGCAELDQNFEQTSKETARIDTHSEFSEDPRCVKVGDQFYISYNDVLPKNRKNRTIHIVSVDPHNLSTKFVTNLDRQLKPVEKNWAPFEYIDDQGNAHLYFEYYISERDLIEIADPSTNQITELKFSSVPKLNEYHWPEVWGKPRGGSAARLVGNEYLSFFHSSFCDDDGINWYIMAAYTFEAKPPFRITSVSNYPILFKGIYDSSPLNTANPIARCVFPGSFALEKRDGKDLIHLACGENDSAVKIITLDKEALFKSMKKI